MGRNDWMGLTKHEITLEMTDFSNSENKELRDENERLRNGTDIESVEGAKAYLESKGIDVEESIKRGLTEIDIIRLTGNRPPKQ